MANLERDDSYLNYLPEILRGDPGEPRAEPTFLEKFVSIFETLISGDPNSEGQPSKFTPPEKVIDGLHHLFNPRRTRPELLPELARWVALRLPPLDTSATNEETRRWISQARLLIERMPLFYPRRWLKHGLYEALDVFVVNELKPRIVIDDGEALSMIALGEPIESRVFPVARARTFGHPSGLSIPFLVHPMSVATAGTATDPRLVVCDLGLTEIGADRRRAAVWRLSVNGEPLDFTTTEAGMRPLPVNEADFTIPAPPSALVSPIGAVELAPDGPTGAITVFVLDQGNVSDENPDARLVTYTRAAGASSFTSVALSIPATFALDLIHDGHSTIYVLDRGTTFPSASRCRLHAINTTAGTLKTIDVGKVKEPRALAIGPRQANDPPLVLLIADASRQAPIGPNEPGGNPSQLHGNLLRLAIDPAALPPTLDAVPLLHTEQDTPLLSADRFLIQPTGLAVDPDDPNLVYVCDQGYKWNTGGFGVDTRHMSEPAKIVRIDLRNLSAGFAPVTLPNQLGFPARLAALRGGMLAVVDHGYSFLLSEKRSDLRARPHHFTVQVLYSRDRLDPDPVKQAAQRAALNNGIFETIEAEKPAHTVWARMTTN